MRRKTNKIRIKQKRTHSGAHLCMAVAVCNGSGVSALAWEKIMRFSAPFFLQPRLPIRERVAQTQSAYMTGHVTIPPIRPPRKEAVLDKGLIELNAQAVQECEGAITTLFARWTRRDQTTSVREAAAVATPRWSIRPPPVQAYQCKFR